MLKTAVPGAEREMGKGIQVMGLPSLGPLSVQDGEALHTKVGPGSPCEVTTPTGPAGTSCPSLLSRGSKILAFGA